jgi:dTDP-4-dehydrorhamnose 3,5-epimerase-like enzyme
VPFATTDLIHLVYHGDEEFAHRRYGVHRGLEDHLTFLGSPAKQARGYFIDCRTDSRTRGVRVALDFSPDPTQMLTIPCGVGHGFEGLEGVYTLNHLRAYLPHPSLLLTEQNPWATGADIYNFPYDILDEDLPKIVPNPFPASETFYEVLSEMQKATLGTIEYEFPHTEDVIEPDGRAVTLMFKKRLSEQQALPDWTPIDGIAGLGWQKHLLVWAGPDAGYAAPDAGYAALADPTPLQVISHGEDHYVTDAYGIHLEWEDRLTFVGPPDQMITIHFIDCRKGSPTAGRGTSHRFFPSPLQMLIIPPGVAHAFDGLERVFTVNRPVRRAGRTDNFEPGNDVIDWPLAKRPSPRFTIAPAEFDFAYYRELAERQRLYLASRQDQLSTPSVLLVPDGRGGQVSVALRRQATEATSGQRNIVLA